MVYGGISSNDGNGNGRASGPIHTGRLGSLSFEVGAIRLPSEGGSHSLLL